jgi:hypothetical protein
MLLVDARHLREIVNLEEDVAKHEHERRGHVTLELADGVGEAKSFFLFDISNADTQVAAVAERIDDAPSEVADDDDDVVDAESAQVIELIREQRLVADGRDRLGHRIAEGSHARAVACREDYALVSPARHALYSAEGPCPRRKRRTPEGPGKRVAL